MKRIGFAVLLALWAGPVLAHGSHGAAEGLWAGLLHPLLGPDHLLAMLAVGLWSGFVLPRGVWTGAAVFMGAMAVGAGISWAGIGFPMVETGILASVVVFGLLVLVARRDQPQGATRAALAAIAVFAAAHGHAHATEAQGVIWHYLAGFLISTAGLHLVGIGIARQVAGLDKARLVQRGIGAGMLASGLAMMAG